MQWNLSLIDTNLLVVVLFIKGGSVGEWHTEEVLSNSVNNIIYYMHVSTYTTHNVVIEHKGDLGMVDHQYNNLHLYC